MTTVKKIQTTDKHLQPSQRLRVDGWSVQWHEESYRREWRIGRMQQRPALRCVCEKRSLWLSMLMDCHQHLFHSDDRRHQHWSEHKPRRPKTHADHSPVSRTTKTARQVIHSQWWSRSGRRGSSSENEHQWRNVFFVRFPPRPVESGESSCKVGRKRRALHYLLFHRQLEIERPRCSYLKKFTSI